MFGSLCTVISTSITVEAVASRIMGTALRVNLVAAGLGSQTVSDPSPSIQTSAPPPTDPRLAVGTKEVQALSPGAKIAIGIGVPGIVIALRVVLFFYWRHRRHRHTSALNLENTGQGHPDKDVRGGSEKHELEANEDVVSSRRNGPIIPKPELDATHGVNDQAKPIMTAIELPSVSSEYWRHELAHEVDDTAKIRPNYTPDVRSRTKATGK